MKVYYVDGVFRRTFHTTQRAADKEADFQRVVFAEHLADPQNCVGHPVDAIELLNAYESRVLILRKDNAKLRDRIEQLEKKMGCTEIAGE